MLLLTALLTTCILPPLRCRINFPGKLVDQEQVEGAQDHFRGPLIPNLIHRGIPFENPHGSGGVFSKRVKASENFWAVSRAAKMPFLRSLEAPAYKKKRTYGPHLGCQSQKRLLVRRKALLSSNFMM
jgi:hypothetical protein